MDSFFEGGGYRRADGHVANRTTLCPGVARNAIPTRWRYTILNIFSRRNLWNFQRAPFTAA
jgi:hypothetical protein